MTPTGARPSRPDALLLMQPGCAHCPRVLEALVSLLEHGLIARLEVVNVMEYPERAREAGTRSVPWTRIGTFELPGNFSEAELRRWAQEAAHEDGVASYYFDLLDNGHLPRASARVRGRPDELADLLGLLHRDEVPMSVRVGISAIVEEHAGGPALSRVYELLRKLSGDPTPATRADVAHYLGLTGLPAAAPVLRTLLKDTETQVREVAAEALEILDHHENG